MADMITNLWDRTTYVLSHTYPKVSPPRSWSDDYEQKQRQLLENWRAEMEALAWIENGGVQDDQRA